MMRSAKRILLGSAPSNVAALRSTRGIAAGSRATCATTGLSLPTAAWNLGSTGGGVTRMEPTAGDPFCSFFVALVDAAPLLFILASAAAQNRSGLMKASLESYSERAMHASCCGA